MLQDSTFHPKNKMWGVELDNPIRRSKISGKITQVTEHTQSSREIINTKTNLGERTVKKMTGSKVTTETKEKWHLGSVRYTQPQHHPPTASRGNAPQATTQCPRRFPSTELCTGLPQAAPTAVLCSTHTWAFTGCRICAVRTWTISSFSIRI